MPLPLNDAGEVELGAIGPDLRLWRAREAVRQGELALISQSQARDNLQTRATGLLGWAVTAGVAAVGGATLAGAQGRLSLAAALVTLWLLATAVACVWAAFPRRWARPGYDPVQILGAAGDSELEVLEGLARGLDADIIRNRGVLILSSIALRAAWLVFATTPLPASPAFLTPGAP